MFRRCGRTLAWTWELLNFQQLFQSFNVLVGFFWRFQKFSIFFVCQCVFNAIMYNSTRNKICFLFWTFRGVRAFSLFKCDKKHNFYKARNLGLASIGIQRRPFETIDRKVLMKKLFVLKQLKQYWPCMNWSWRSTTGDRYRAIIVDRKEAISSQTAVAKSFMSPISVSVLIDHGGVPQGHHCFLLSNSSLQRVTEIKYSGVDW